MEGSFCLWTMIMGNVKLNVEGNIMPDLSDSVNHINKA